MNVTAVLTSCGRADLLERTLESFERFNDSPVKLIIGEDSGNPEQHRKIARLCENKYQLIINPVPLGQARNLDMLYNLVETEFLFHMEDDWEFLRYNPIEDSLYIMSGDESIGLVALDLRHDYWKVGAVGEPHDLYYECPLWRISPNHLWWHGWAGSPHLLRKSTWEKLGRFSSVENEVEYDKLYGASGLRTVWAKHTYVAHIGYGRSTMGDYKKWI